MLEPVVHGLQCGLEFRECFLLIFGERIDMAEPLMCRVRDASELSEIAYVAGEYVLIHEERSATSHDAIPFRRSGVVRWRPNDGFRFGRS